MMPILKDAYYLIHNGILAFADIEQNGIQIDIRYCKKVIKRIEGQIKELNSAINLTKEAKFWRKKYGNKTNFDSTAQLSDILFKELKIESTKQTEKGNKSVDQESLEAINLPMVQILLRMRKLRKIKTTYLGNIMRETVNGFIHPFFNLHSVSTYRSSSNSPNFQNIPIRDAEMGKLIRRAFLPRKGRQLIEVDYGGIEVRVAACYHKDPAMLKYIRNPTRDMHRDMAMECYKLEKKQVTKDTRYCGKNQFVFPQFYGDYYLHCAVSLWNSISSMKLKTRDGIGLREHLKAQGINSYKKFERHIQKVEDNFWNRRFKVYKQWKEDHYADYEKIGYFDTLTGFRCSGLMGKNDAINYPIQGTAFHCLLFSLIQLNHWMKCEELRSCIVGQIHDSIIIDAVPKEVSGILEMIKQIMTRDIRLNWNWIIVPLEIEAEATEVDGNWYEKERIKI